MNPQAVTSILAFFSCGKFIIFFLTAPVTERQFQSPGIKIELFIVASVKGLPPTCLILTAEGIATAARKENGGP